MRGRRLVVAAVSLVLTVGCSSGATTATAPTAGGSTTSAPQTTIAAPPNLTPDLLTLSDMPTGWSVDNSPSPDSTGPACLKPLKDHTGSNAHATVSFNGGASGIPAIVENLGHFPSGASAALARFDQAINSCKTLSITSGGQTLSGTIGAMSFPQLGDESHAYQASLTYKGFTLGYDVIIARHGDTAMSLTYGDLGSPDLTQVQQFATKAIAKVR
jgi:hypothetical protein